MSLLSPSFLALLLTGPLLGLMLTFSLVLPRVAERVLGDAPGRAFLRRARPSCHAIGLGLSLAGAVCVASTTAGLLLALTGLAFLLRLLWLWPAYRRQGRLGLEGDRDARHAAQHLYQVDVAIDLLQIVLVLLAFVLIARG